MKVTIGKTSYTSTFTQEDWVLENDKEKLEIPYYKIYNWVGNKVYKKTDMFTVFFMAVGILFVSVYLIFVFVLPVLFYYHYLKRVRLDCEQGSVFVKFETSADKEEFLRSCKKHIKKQRLAAFGFKDK